MGSIFGKHKAKSAVTEQDRAVLQLKQQRDRLNQYTRRIARQMERERSVAKQLLCEGKKEKALLLLKKKRYFDKLLDQTNKQLNNIEQLVNDIEFAQVQLEVVNRLDSGNQALKRIHEVMSLENVEQIMDETREAQAYQEEIDALISGSLTSKDIEIAESELDKLVATLGEQLPEAPTHKLPTVADEDRQPTTDRSRSTRTAVLAS